MRKTLDSHKVSAMYEDAKRIIAATNWSGFCMLELKYNENSYVFIETNPRIWGSIGQGLSCGRNYFRGLLGDIDNLAADDKIITYQSPLYLLSFFGNLFRHTVSISEVLKYRKQGIPDVSIFDPFAYIGQFIR